MRGKREADAAGGARGPADEPSLEARGEPRKRPRPPRTAGDLALFPTSRSGAPAGSRAAGTALRVAFPLTVTQPEAGVQLEVPDGPLSSNSPAGTVSRSPGEVPLGTSAPWRGGGGGLSAAHARLPGAHRASLPASRARTRSPLTAPRASAEPGDHGRGAEGGADRVQGSRGCVRSTPPPHSLTLTLTRVGASQPPPRADTRPPPSPPRTHPRLGVAAAAAAPRPAGSRIAGSETKLQLPWEAGSQVGAREGGEGAGGGVAGSGGRGGGRRASESRGEEEAAGRGPRGPRFRRGRRARGRGGPGAREEERTAQISALRDLERMPLSQQSKRGTD